MRSQPTGVVKGFGIVKRLTNEDVLCRFPSGENEGAGTAVGNAQKIAGYVANVELSDQLVFGDRVTNQ